MNPEYLKLTKQQSTCNSSKHLVKDLDVIDKIRDRIDNNWYNRVYLCYEDVPYNHPNDSLPIKGFMCYRFNSFDNADIEHKKLIFRTTMIPICKWVPEIFDKYILNWKLRNIFWLGEHTLRRGYNYYPKEK